MNTDALVNSIQQASSQLQKGAAAMKEAYSSIEAANKFISEYLELESRSEQGAGKPQRSVAQILADEAARTNPHQVGDRPTDLRSWTDQFYQNVEQALNRLAIQQEAQPLKGVLGLTKEDSTISVKEVGDREYAPTDQFDKAWARLDEKLKLQDAERNLLQKDFYWVDFSELSNTYRNYTLLFCNFTSSIWINVYDSDKCQVFSRDVRLSELASTSKEVKEYLDLRDGLVDEDAQSHIHDPWAEKTSDKVSRAEFKKIFNWVTFYEIEGIYLNYHLYFTSDDKNIDVLIDSHTQSLRTFTCLNNYSEVQALSSEIKQWIDADYLNPKSPPLSESIALNKAFILKCFKNVDTPAISDRVDAQSPIHDPWAEGSVDNLEVNGSLVIGVKQSRKDKPVSLKEVKEIFDWAEPIEYSVVRPLSILYKHSHKSNPPYSALYQNYSLHFSLNAEILYIAALQTDAEPAAVWTCTNQTDWTCSNIRSEVEKLSADIKQWVDNQIDCQNSKPKSQEAAQELAAAFDWVIWSLVQPSGLSGEYRNRKLDIRHEGADYVVYYAGNSYSFRDILLH